MKTDLKSLLAHPLPISVASGLVNGTIAKMRGKQIDIKTAAILGTVQGLSEAALAAYQKPEKGVVSIRRMSLAETALWGMGGFFIGLAPFVLMPKPDKRIVPSA